MTEAEKYYRENRPKGNMPITMGEIYNIMQSFSAEQVAKALEKIEKSLPSDVEIKVLKLRDYKAGVIVQRNKTQKAINKLKKV